MARVAADTLLALSVLFLPLWVTCIIGAMCFIYFDSYHYEFLASALVFDVLYGAPQSRFGGFEFVVTLGALLTLTVLIPLRRRMRISHV